MVLEGFCESAPVVGVVQASCLTWWQLGWWVKWLMGSKATLVVDGYKEVEVRF